MVTFIITYEGSGFCNDVSSRNGFGPVVQFVLSSGLSFGLRESTSSAFVRLCYKQAVLMFQNIRNWKW